MSICFFKKKDIFLLLNPKALVPKQVHLNAGFIGQLAFFSSNEKSIALKTSNLTHRFLVPTYRKNHILHTQEHRVLLSVADKNYFQ
ncbi:MAG: hypothetical protein CR997_11355 [Acidobacteria bacterium]|nr:MAG: hypothetical protein CR997_11355 [Acidobacteriota bacterium]